MISFRVVKKEIFYYLYKWNEDALMFSLLLEGKYNNENPKDLITLEIKSEQK